MDLAVCVIMGLKFLKYTHMVMAAEQGYFVQLIF